MRHCNFFPDCPDANFHADSRYQRKQEAVSSLEEKLFGTHGSTGGTNGMVIDNSHSRKIVTGARNISCSMV